MRAVGPCKPELKYFPKSGSLGPLPDVTECIWLSELIHLTELPISISSTGGENSSGPEEIVTVLLAAVVFEVRFDSTEILLG